ncbi:uncharacterized protein GGS25DRAFT_524061 [Hypoxylon fragiforme]|uniref:uncharacterized protein n=1 Tax=Hypoxylon fragiforme TaxID=63214 RepID=UPI0020C6F16A|nr:uncharacterized protein GGS25DRAFT_524061 [Hypoxylon fragiforme]KAI2606394.1 hypothetical protein GGS25DRAFT_524061 [Hypoxylon fragiforme]
MFSRLRSEQTFTPLKSDPPRRLGTLKRRLQINEDEDEDELCLVSPKKKKQAYYSAAPLFNKFKRFKTDEVDRHIPRTYNRRQRMSPSPDPEPAVITELQERYANLRAILHSAALAGLEEAEANVLTRSEADIRANRQKAATLDSQVTKLLAPLQDLTVDYTATGEDGQERTVAIAISNAITTFKKKLEAAVAELGGLWAS